MLGRLILIGSAAAMLAACGDTGGTRTQITAVGSSTVYPFTTRVAESFKNQDPSRDAPVIESIGTGGGIARFCDGVGAEYPDIANASRRMKRVEFIKCQNNGVTDVMEIQIGMDGVAMAESVNGPSFELTKRDVYLALAATPGGKPNTSKTWRDVNPDLPAIPIQVYGPPSTSGTRDALAELVMKPGCKEVVPDLDQYDEGQQDLICLKIRDDGAYIDAGENDNLIVQKLDANPNAVGIFGYSYLEENQDRLRGIPIEGVEPTYETIADGSYPGARALYIYVKKQHLNAVPGLKDFLRLYASMWGPDGDLTKRGLIAGSPEQRGRAEDVIDQQIILDPQELS